MKLATYNDGSRDGQLVVVSRDLRQAHYATGIASRLQQVLDDWSFLAPQLQDLAHQLQQGRAPHAFAFDPSLCMAPLPRPCQWIAASAYAPQLELAAQAQGLPATSVPRREVPLRQGSGDTVGGACDEVVVSSQALAPDFEAMVAVITGDVPQGCSAEQALHGVRLVVLANDWCLRQLVAGERERGCVGVQSRPAVGLSPVAVTLDELGEAWKGGRVHLPVHCSWNGRRVGQNEAGEGMHWGFGEILAQLCQTRSLRAGTIVGSGGVLNAASTVGRGKDKRLEWTRGYSCIADKRAMEQVEAGAPSTDYLRFGDSVRIEAKNQDGLSVFGAIDQTLVSPLGEGAA